MSKKQKQLAQSRKVARNRASKADNIARANERKALGITKKRKNQKGKFSSRSHPFGPCCNAGCKQCDPIGIWKK